jgi:GNAT superfamily N-acetyltransferase
MIQFKQWLENELPEATWGPSSLIGSNGTSLRVNGGYIDIQPVTKWSPRSQSVIDFFVDEAKRNQGIGDWLVKQAKLKFKDLGAQVSSIPSMKVFFNNGFRNPNMANQPFEDHVKEFQNNGSSLFLAMNDDQGKPYFAVSS